MRVLLVTLLLFFVAATQQSAFGQDISGGGRHALDGAWEGRIITIVFFLPVKTQLNLQVDGAEVHGYWQALGIGGGSKPLTGVLTDNGANIWIGGMRSDEKPIQLTLLSDGRIQWSAGTGKGKFKKLDKEIARLPPMDNMEKAAAISSVANQLYQTGTAMRSGSNSVAVLPGIPTTSSSGTCNGYPLEARGDHPPGRVCRCTISSKSSQPGWWAVVPGNEGAGAIACGPPRDGGAAVAYTAQDEDRAELARLNAWNAEQQRQKELQAAAERERAMQQQIADQQAQIARMRQQQEQQQQQRQRQQQGGQVAAGQGQSGSSLPNHSPNQCFSDRVSTEGDNSVIYLTNRCNHRVYWDVCVNRANAPWNDHYPGHTDPGGQSSIRMWQPGEKTSAVYRYNTSFDGSQRQPSC